MRRSAAAVTPLPNPATPADVKAFLELATKARHRRLAHSAKFQSPTEVYEVLLTWQDATKRGRWAKKHRQAVAGDLTWLASCWSLRSGLEDELLSDLELADQDVTPIHLVRRNPLSQHQVFELLDLPPDERHRYYAARATHAPATAPQRVLEDVMQWAHRAAAEGWDDAYVDALAADLAWLQDCYAFEIVQRGPRYAENPAPAPAPARPRPRRGSPPSGKGTTMPLATALQLLEKLKRAFTDAGVLAPRGGRGDFVVAGSVRRRKPHVGDLDVLLVDPPNHRWAALEAVQGLTLVQFGPKKARGTYRGLQVDIRRVGRDHLGAALEYFTGPRGHNLGMRQKAKQRGMKLNEYGLWRGDELVAAATEREIYEALDHPWKPPHDRGR